MSDTTNQLASMLIGKRLWICRRAADMATFQFGHRTSVTTFRGGSAEVGEFALHVQCAWRMLKHGALYVGSHDLFYPAGQATDQSVPVNFDWDSSLNRRDVLLQELFSGQEFEVRSVKVGTAGTCRIDFDQSLTLEIFPDDSLRSEHWRVFATTDENGPSIVF